MYNRREFLESSLAALGVAAAFDPRTLLVGQAPKKILILGGTGFVGPHQVRYALKRGHQVTIFNRGKSAPGLFGKDVEELAGDRAADLSALKGRTWDAVIDESASLSSAPEWVKLSANLLKDNVGQYLFISTRSTYLDTSRVPMTADAPVLTLENSPIEAGKPLTYGHAKAYAEKEAHAAMPGRVTVVRPGLIVGPEDDTDRFTYWPVRTERGGAMLAPGSASDPIQVIDVRDLAEWMVHVAETRTYGVFNAVGPNARLSMGEMLAACKAASVNDAKFIWVDAEFLSKQEGVDLPIWAAYAGETRGFHTVSHAAALKAGLKSRPIAQTTKDTLVWFHTLPAERQAKLKAGLSPEAEAKLLAAFAASASK